MDKKDQSEQKQFIVQKRNGRLEPFNETKMSRAISRAGTPFVMARDISASVKESLLHANLDDGNKNKHIAHKIDNNKIIIPSSRLRELITIQLVNRNQSAIAESYSGYSKNGVTAMREEMSRGRTFDYRVYASTNTHAKQFVKDKDNTSGRGSKVGSH